MTTTESLNAKQPPASDSGVVKRTEHYGAAQAQPNIALVKYWGKRDAALNLPAVGSISVTLDSLWTKTEVNFVPGLTHDDVMLNGKRDEAQTRRALACLDLLRRHAGIDWRAQVNSRNNFPTAAGLASSASGFAALVQAINIALRLQLTESELSVLARRCSGSAARSIFGGYVEWSHGGRADGTDSVAYPLLGASAWPLRVAVAITSTASKSIGSTDGMHHTRLTSPFYDAWITTQEADLRMARHAIAARDLDALASVSEHSCLKMHALALAAQPGLLYWNGATVECIHRVRSLRKAGVPVFFTVDAGPQVKAICEPQAFEQVRTALQDIPGVLDVLDTGLGEGARAITDTEMGR